MPLPTGYLPAGFIPAGLDTVSALSGTTPPALSGLATATVSAASVTVTLALPAATDASFASSSLTYRVYKDGAATPVASGITTSTWSETVVADGSTHTYQIAVVDPSGISSAESVPISVHYAVVANSNTVAPLAATISPRNSGAYTVNPNDTFVLAADGISIVRIGNSGSPGAVITFDVLGGSRINTYDTFGYLVSSTFVPHTGS